MGQSRRSKGGRAGPAAICQAFVTNEGSVMSAAASTGAMAKLKRPMPTVGRPRPVTPLVKPARRKAAIRMASSVVVSCMGRKVAPLPKLPQCGIA